MRRKTGISCANTAHFDGEKIFNIYAVLFNVYESKWLDSIFVGNVSLLTKFDKEI